MSDLLKPKDIKKELSRLFDMHKQKNKVKASLFNLIVYTKKNSTLGYFKKLAEFVSNKFPCRILLIEEDPSNETNEISSRVLVKLIGDQNQKVLCEQISIYLPSSNKKKVSSILLPHILTDLPIYLLWSEKPCLDDPLFNQLKNMSQRLIFDSNSVVNFQKFSLDLLKNFHFKHLEITDLNWVKLEGWRQIFKNVFNDRERLNAFSHLKELTIFYSETKTSKKSNLILALYMQSWIAAQLNWKYLLSNKEGSVFSTTYKSLASSFKCSLVAKKIDFKDPNAIDSIQLVYNTNQEMIFQHLPEQEIVRMTFCDLEKCDLPHNVYLTHSKWEFSFAREICYKETSQHYINMLKALSEIKGDIC